MFAASAGVLGDCVLSSVIRVRVYYSTRSIHVLFVLLRR